MAANNNDVQNDGESTENDEESRLADESVDVAISDI